MTAVYPTLPKLAVRDSIADDDDLTDIDDEVFIRDGRNGGLKLDHDGGVKRPLMAPRRKCKKSCNFQTHRVPYRALFVPLCYGMIALIIILGLIILCIFTVNIFPMPLTILKNWLSEELKDSVNTSKVIPCTSLSSKVLWTKTLPKLTSEAPLRSNDVNLDGIEDIIVGFSTGLDTIDAPEYICTRYFAKQTPCLGGVLALNGKTGDIIWTHWTAHAIFSVDCSVEITLDNVKDCVISGRGGILQAINGHDGTNIWEIPIQDTPVEQQRILDVYDARFTADIDGDGIADVIASRTTQSNDIQTSNVLIVSGRTGKIIRNINLPDTEQLFIAPQVMVHPDEANIFVLATSSQQEGGGLYIMSQANIFYGDVQLRKLHHNTGKGALVPPILIDITSDGIEDIVAAMFNSTIIAYNGSTFEPIWNYTVPNSEVISIPIPGYYNDDDIPDFMVKHQIGVGFLTYYYTVATIIDGRNGQPLLEKEVVDSLSRQMSGLSITVDGFGNDWFLHWSADCLNYEGVKEQYQFMKDQSLVSQTRADLCRLRFNSTLATRLLALSQHVGPPGMSLYFSEDWKSVEFNNSFDPRKEADKYLGTYSQLMDTYGDQPLVSERSPKVHKNYQKGSNFKHKNNNLLAEIGTYDPDAIYENVDEFKTHKKHNPAVVDRDEDGAENANVDRAWKHDSNKWIGDTARSDKEYDGLYGSDDGNNEDSEQNMDYPQAEVRERRSVGEIEDSYSANISRQEHVTEEISTRLILSNWTQRDSRLNNDDIEKVRKLEDSNSTMNNSTDEADMMNVSTASVPNLQMGTLSTMSNNNSNVEEITAIQDTPATAKESVEVNSTQFNPETLENALAEASNVTKHQTIDGDQGVTSATDKLASVAQQRQIYKSNFPIAEDANDDASIEKVFKRESLKNQNKGRLNGKQSLILSSVVGNDYRTRERRRTKRKSEIRQTGDVSGIQRQPPTGILLPSIAESEGRKSIDLVFSTFWLPPSEVSLILSQADLECIHRKKALSGNKFSYKTDDDIIAECLSERGVNYRLYQESKDRENVKIALGQMTIYRMKLECACPEDILPNQTCRDISSQQSWSQHLGPYGNGYFKPLKVN